MSRTPCFFVEKYNVKEKKYELQHPYVWDWNHTKLVEADLFPYNGCHDMFSIVEDEANGIYPEMKGITYGIPDDACPEIKAEYEKYNDYNTKPTVRWFTYADLYIYLLEHPKVKNYDRWDCDGNEDESEPEETDSPLFTLKKRVDTFLEVTNDFGIYDSYSLIRIVYWIS